MLLDELGARFLSASLASSSGVGGWYLALGTLPDSTQLPDKFVAILKTGGEVPILNLKVDQPTFQVLVRGDRINQISTAFQDAELKAEHIKMNLHGLGRVTLSGVEYYGILAEQEPFYLGDDDNQRPVFSCNFKAWRQSTSST